MKINAVKKIRSLFLELDVPLTLLDIKEQIPALRPNDISMALCYFLRQKQVSIKLILNPNSKGRKEIYQYTYLGACNAD